MSETYGYGSFGGAAALGAAADQALLADIASGALTAARMVARAARADLPEPAATPELAWFHAAQLARAVLDLPLWDDVEAFRTANPAKGGSDGG